MLTISGRAQDEWRSLITQANLRIVRVHALRGMVSAIECEPVRHNKETHAANGHANGSSNGVAHAGAGLNGLNVNLARSNGNGVDSGSIVVG